MHRVDSPGSVAGLFQDGNPAVGQQATQLLSAWFNDVQENLCHVIEEAGLTLDKGDETQLLAALTALIAGVVGTGGGSVPTTRQVQGSGLVTGGGDLTANRTLTVAKATGAQVIAGLLDDRAVTPLGLASAFAASLGDNGYMKLPGGGIMQWGQVRTTLGEGTFSVTFPIAFTQPPFILLPIAYNANASDDRDTWPQNYARTATGATFFAQYDGGGGSSISGIDYFAIGK